MPADVATRLGADTLAEALACGERGWGMVPVHNVRAGRCSCGDPSTVKRHLRALEGRGHLLIRRSPFNRDLGRRERRNRYVFVALQPPVPQRLRPQKRKCVPRGARRHTPRAEVCAPGFETLSLTLKGSAGQCGGCSPARVPPSRRS